MHTGFWTPMKIARCWYHLVQKLWRLKKKKRKKKDKRRRRTLQDLLLIQLNRKGSSQNLIRYGLAVDFHGQPGMKKSE